MVWLGTQGASAFAKDGWHASLAQQRHLAVQGDIRETTIDLFEFGPRARGFSLGFGQPGPVSICCTISNGKIKISQNRAQLQPSRPKIWSWTWATLCCWAGESGELWEPALQYEIDRNPRCNGRTPKNSNLSGTGWIFRRVIPRDHGRWWSWVYTLLCWVVSTSFNYQGIFKHGPHLGRWSKWLVVGVVWITSLN